MKKRMLSILFVLLMSFSLSFTAFVAQDTQRLYDDADLLTRSEERKLANRLDDVSEEYEVDIIIVTVETIGHYTPNQYIEYFYDENNCGYGEDRDGVLLLVTMEEREYRILSNGFAAKAISSDDIDDIGDTISDYLSDGEYAEAFHSFVDECEYQIDGELNGFPFAFGKNLLISLVIGLVAALIVTSIMAGELKSVKKQLAATEYTKQGSMKVTSSSDMFLYRTVDRRKKESDSSSSSSSSSSRNIGGGKF